MPFDFLKKKTSNKADKVEPPKAQSKVTKAMGFDEAEDALKPNKADKPDKAALPSLRHALKLGKKEVDPATQKAALAACDPIGQAMSQANNIERRALDFNADCKKEGSTQPELAAKVSRLAAACKKFDSVGSRLIAAHADFQKRGFMTPLKAAIDDAIKAGREVRVLLTGLTGPGDSVAEGSLMGDFFAVSVNGVQAGPKDTAAGKVPDAPAKGHDTQGAMLPMGGGGAGIWAKAIRGYGADFVTYYDRIVTGAAGL